MRPTITKFAQIGLVASMLGFAPIPASAIVTNWDYTVSSLFTSATYSGSGGSTASLLVGTKLTGAVIGLRGGYKGVSWDVFAGMPIDKPEGFRTASHTGGFNVSWGF